MNVDVIMIPIDQMIPFKLDKKVVCMLFVFFLIYRLMKQSEEESALNFPYLLPCKVDPLNETNNKK